MDVSDVVVHLRLSVENLPALGAGADVERGVGALLVIGQQLLGAVLLAAFVAVDRLAVVSPPVQIQASLRGKCLTAILTRDILRVPLLHVHILDVSQQTTRGFKLEAALWTNMLCVVVSRFEMPLEACNSLTA